MFSWGERISTKYGSKGSGGVEGSPAVLLRESPVPLTAISIQVNRAQSTVVVGR
jgi:hypothetical protein